MHDHNHPDDERLSALAGGDAEARADEALRAHVDACRRCSGLLSDLHRLRVALHELPDIAPSRPIQLLPPVDEPRAAGGGWTAGMPTAWIMEPTREPMIAVKMNDEPLPRSHGYPARLIIPGLYGYVSATKWLAELELTTLESEHRRVGRIERLLRDSKLPLEKTLDSFNMKRLPAKLARQVRSLRCRQSGDRRRNRRS